MRDVSKIIIINWEVDVMSLSKQSISVALITIIDYVKPSKTRQWIKKNF